MSTVLSRRQFVSELSGVLASLYAVPLIGEEEKAPEEKEPSYRIFFKKKLSNGKFKYLKYSHLIDLNGRTREPYEITDEESEIWAINEGGTGLSQITRNVEEELYPVLSRTGRFLAYATVTPNKELTVPENVSSVLHVHDMETGRECVHIPEENDFFFRINEISWHPNEKGLAISYSYVLKKDPIKDIHYIFFFEYDHTKAQIRFDRSRRPIGKYEFISPSNNIYHETTGVFNPSFSPNGQDVAFLTGWRQIRINTGSDPSKAEFHWKREKPGERARYIHDYDDKFPIWSTKGDRILYFSKPRERGNYYRLCTIDREGREKVLTPEEFFIPLTALINRDRYDRLPSWSPDDRTVAFRSRDGPVFYHNPAPELSVNTINVETGKRQQITKEVDVAGFPIHWSPDGTKMAFSALKDDRISLFTVNADGTELKRLTDEPEIDIVVGYK